MSEKVKIDEDTIVIKADKGYLPHIDVLCTITDTGNGFIAHFPTYLETMQDNYVCLSYCEADYLVKGLRKYFKRSINYEDE